MSSMKFRRSCSSCNATFFASDRRAQYCPKCQRKKPEPRVEPVREMARPMPIGGARRPERSERVFTSAPRPMAKPQKKAPAKEAAPRRTARPPKANELTDELRKKIETSYLSLKDSIDSFKKLHAQISQELWVKTQVVADVLTRFRRQLRSKEHCTLSAPERQAVIARYLEFVRTLTRPTEGRRSAIAKELHLPDQEVVLAVREWSNEIMNTLDRMQLFAIEKEYWRMVENGGHRFAELPELIAAHLGFASADQVARWLDQLHDESKLSTATDSVAAEKVESLIKHYHEYLQEPKPPEKSLHTTLAKLVELLPSQVHQVLCEYRCRRRPK